MTIKIIHYLNQFFAGKGGEESADHPLQVINGPVGPGKILEQELGKELQITTVFCGDGYFSSHEKEVLEEIGELISQKEADVLISGPSFSSGRYGLACGAVASHAMKEAGIPAIAGMAEDNPAVEIYRKKSYIVPTGDSVRNMAEGIQRIARFAERIATGKRIGSPEDEGYLPRGIRKNSRKKQPAETRALEMLLQKLKGQKISTELKLEPGRIVLPPPPLSNLTEAKIAVVTECGVVPKGNPDKIEGVRTAKWNKYSFEGLQSLSKETHESVHGGYNNSMINQDPNRGVPLDALRMLELEGFFSKLHETYYVTVGNWGNVGEMEEIGRIAAKELKEAGVNGVLVPST